MRQLLYDSAPLRFSDHRPVYAAFECRVSIVDEAHRDSISQELYARRKAEVGDSIVHIGDIDDTDDEDLIGYDAIEPGLPPASSDRQKWWLDNKQPARAQIAVPNGRDGLPMAPNPHRPSNPFSQTEESDWISIPRSSSKTSLSSISSSPYEKVSLPRAMASASGTNTISRKPQPSYESATLPARVGRMNLGSEQGPGSSSAAGGVPPPPPPRRQVGTAAVGSAAIGTTPDKTQAQASMEPLRPDSAASQLSQLSFGPQASGLSQQLRGGRPAPPVARKPAHLTTSSPISSPSPRSLTGSSMESATRTAQPSLPARAATTRSAATSNGAKPRPPDLPSRSKSQARPPQQQRGQVDLLDSLGEGDGQMGSWETLEPSKAK